MKLPVLIINFKTYTESSGRRGIELAQAAEKVAKEYGVSFVVVPQLIDAKVIAQEVDIDVFHSMLILIPQEVRQDILIFKAYLKEGYQARF